MAIHYTEPLDRTFHALGDGSRRRLLATISRNGPCSAGDLATLFESAQPTISKHLKVLEEAELIARSIEGRRHIFSLQPDRMRYAREWIETHLRFWQTSFDQLDGLLEEMMQSKERQND